MGSDDLLCPRKARPQKGRREAARPSFLLAEGARSECAPSMRAPKDCLTNLRFRNLLLPILSQPSKSHPHRRAKVLKNHDRHGASWFGLFW